MLITLIVSICLAQEISAKTSEIPVASPNISPTAGPSSLFSAETPGLKTKVDFWVSIYGKYTTKQGLIHDSKYIDKIYEVLDLDSEERGARRRQVKQAERKWKQILLSVHHKQKNPDQLNPEERKVFDLFKDVDEPNKFLAATHRKRLRFQLGQKDRFQEGLFQSGRFLPLMEQEFKKAGLPLELTRLPFVESSFNVKARSKVGASGVWQFMRSTGKLYLRINDAVDERNDPIRATEAAAQKLRLNYEALGNWPLAVTAYNHGRQGMMRAVRKVASTELDVLIKNYRSRLWGFASSNFYACLLAAIEVERNVDKYFGRVERAPPLAYYEVSIPDYIELPSLSRFLKLKSDEIREYNPGLTDQVFAGRRRIPAGYRLRLPVDSLSDADGAAKVFLAGYTEIPALYKFKGQRGSR